MIFNSLAYCISKYEDGELFVMNDDNKVLHCEPAYENGNVYYNTIKVRMIYTKNNKNRFICWLSDNINNEYLRRTLWLSSRT